jgi:hypothetical protein
MTREWAPHRVCGVVKKLRYVEDDRPVLFIALIMYFML